MKKDQICGFLLGLGIGSALGSLFAPHSGKRTRTHIAQAAADGAAYAKGRGEAVRGAAQGWVERGAEEIARQKEGVSQAIKRGTEAYQDAVS